MRAEGPLSSQGTVTKTSEGKYDQATLDVELYVNNGDRDAVIFEIFVGTDKILEMKLTPNGISQTSQSYKTTIELNNDQMKHVRLIMSNVNDPSKGPGDTTNSHVTITRK